MQIVMLTLPDDLARQLADKCKELGRTVEQLSADIVRAWLAKETQDARHLSKLTRLMFAQSFIENVPVEACIKDRQSRLIWCNELFRNMVAASSFQEIANKPPEEIWKRDLERAKMIRSLDSEVIDKRKPLCHVDVIRYRGDFIRPRVGIRFPFLNPDTNEVDLIGTLGIDFATREDAQAAHRAIKIEGNWDPEPDTGD